MMKNILFRADSSSTIGTGHIMRDLVLASQYKNVNIIFATQNLDGNINNKIVEANYKIVTLKSNDFEELNTIIKKHSINMIIFDHYGIDYKFEKKIKNNNNHLTVFSFDDTYQQHYCDVLLNHNIGADKKKYKGLVSKNCDLRCGNKYTLLRDEFINEKKKKTILLAMGGADHSHINIKILKILKYFNNLTVHVVTTKANSKLKKLQEYTKNKKWIKLHINSNHLAKLMKKCDFAIVTPSVTLNEVYYMKLPFIAIKTANNQDDIYKYLKKKKFLTLEKFDRKKLFTLIQKKINE